MLETTLSSEFVPSINIRGKVAGASWLFLLPTLPLERTICFGIPPRATLISLANYSNEVIIFSTNPQHIQENTTSTDLSNVRWYPLHESRLEQWADHSADLVLLIGWHNTWRFMREQWSQKEFYRLLKPEGFVYYEYYVPIDPLRGFAQRDNGFFNASCQARFWLAPLLGEASTVVPLHDQETINYFTDRTLSSSSLKVSKPLKRVLRGIHLRKKMNHHQPHNHQAARPPSKLRNKSVGYIKSALRSTYSSLVQVIDRVGTAVELECLRNQRFHRVSALSGCGAETLDRQPPQYLRTSAQNAGISLDGCSWGMVAPADYSSRKLLFFLFKQAQPGETKSLQYIVKMVRNPLLNHRLENEQRALTLLHESSIRDRTALPRVVFAGYHNNLALVGETAVDGVPFRNRTSGNVDCPYLDSAIAWLTDLGGVTANWDTSAVQAANALEMLLSQFLQIYRTTPEQQSFLADQINIVAKSQTSFPSVFQHGDPGLWNLLATSTGQVAFLDWEAAEPKGMPLWDLFYFLRSYSVHAARMNGGRNALHAVRQQFLAETPFSQMTSDAIRRYCERVPLSEELIPPLFYTCWMHRAIKEASRVIPARIEQAHYVSLLRLCMAQHKAVSLRLAPSRSTQDNIDYANR